MKLFLKHVTGERRMARRFAVKVPLRYRLRRKAAEEQTSQSENLSELGVFFSSDETLSIGAAIDVRMEVPANLGDMRAAEWLCIGHAVRMRSNTSGLNFYLMASISGVSLSLNW